MKLFYITLLLLLLLVGCKNTTQKESDTFCFCDEEEVLRVDNDFYQFDKILIDLYNLIETNPDKVISLTDSLTDKIKKEPEPNSTRWSKLGSLFVLKAETFYRMGEYNNSIAEVFYHMEYDSVSLKSEELYIDSHSAIVLACNYVKIKDFNQAKYYLSYASKGWYITNYIFANFYEVVGDTTRAISAYQEILDDGSYGHYLHYEYAKKRMENLTSETPVLLKELYYPSERPDKRITVKPQR